MPKKNSKRDTQKTEQGYEIPIPKREDVVGWLNRAAKKRPGSSKEDRAHKRK